jgi:hypothetical protein
MPWFWEGFRRKARVGLAIVCLLPMAIPQCGQEQARLNTLSCVLLQVNGTHATSHV